MSTALQDAFPTRIFPAADPNASSTSTVDSSILPLPALVLGAGTFGTDYNTPEHLSSSIPVETLRLCFRYGMTALDTSPYYTTSETVVGRALKKLSDEFPRSSYQLITKAGRYGRTRETGFDYSRERVRSSVEKSLELFGTNYLDGCYMHDVEFVSESVGGGSSGGHTVDADGQISEEDLRRWGCAEGDEATVHGPGDEKVLEAMAALFELKKAGKIKAVGFSGYPLPTMLRLARLVAAKLEPLDIMQSYCHHTLQNTTLSSFTPYFKAAGVKQIISASPLSMGLLRTAGGQAWHPASPELQKANTQAIETLAARGVKLEDVALGFGFASAALGEDATPTPIVVGLSKPSEVVATMEVYSKIYLAQNEAARKGRKPGEGLGEANQEQLECERIAVDLFKQSGTYNWTWPSGGL
ncbi:NADP-dependent oxidoreductase domain-containing protein [Leucosporidium creatinivorum]|uniref:NADP-dependent oxidoreductase domain-containing protein n=1 Tax=Leucosporidium creatinivorum TaxID=106004 RepID=A0A1Y2FPQ2_9BASI|nr:NADP-dependent oxidoreductase domain-containing protein [Leucosporidium creatinivorum]